MSVNTRRNCVIAIFIVAVVVLWFGYPRDKPAADKAPQRAELNAVATAANNSVKRVETSQLITTESTASLSPSASSETASAASQCEDIYLQLTSHPGKESFQRWYQQELDAELHGSYYQNLSIDDLLLQAQAADVLAMRLLAEKYLRYAQFQQYDRPEQRQKPSTLDRSALAQARYWAEQAALHGYGGAFFSLLARSYMVELVELDQQLSANPQRSEALSGQKTDTSLLMRAYIQLSVEVMPQLYDFLFPLRRQLQASKLSAEERAHFDEIYQSLLLEWRNKRALLGLPAELEFIIVPEVEQYIQLQNSHHSCIRQN